MLSRGLRTYSIPDINGFDTRSPFNVGSVKQAAGADGLSSAVTAIGQPPELQNLAASLPEEELAAIGQQVWDEYKDDETTRSPWLAMHAHWLNLYYQNDKAKNPPWEDSSTESIPMLAEACNQFHARAMSAFFPNKSIIKAIPTGTIEPEDIKRAERVGKHMSWQLMVKDKTYKAHKDALLLSVALHGSFFTKSYFDPMKNRNVVENVRAEDLVVPYGIGPRDIDDLERKTHVVWMSVNKTKILASSGYFVGPAESYSTPETRDTTAAVDQAHGQQPGNKRDLYDAMLLEQHRLLDLDGDDIGEPYIVTIDAKTKKVLRISIRYETDSIGNPISDKKPIEYFTHYMFLPNPDGFYGLGMGHLIGKINTAVNKFLRQTVDAGTLQNTKSGFVSDTLGIKKGDIRMSMGKFIPIPGMTARISDSIHEMEFSPPSQAIMSMIELLMSRGDRLATVTEALTGQTEKVHQPTAILALIDQGMQLFSSVYERLIDAWSDELRKLYDLNSKYLPESEYVTILDLPGLERFQISKRDYAKDLEIVPVADPKMASESKKLTKAQAEWEFLAQNPLVLSSPQHFYEASKRYLEAIETPNINAVLPQPIIDPRRIDDPQIENMGALMPTPMIPPPHPAQDHLAHIQAHQAFLVDPVYSAYMPPTGIPAMQMHIQMHVAYMFGMTESTLPETLSGQNGSTIMAPEPGYTMVPPQLGGEVPGGAPVAKGRGQGQAKPPSGNGGGTGPY